MDEISYYLSFPPPTTLNDDRQVKNCGRQTLGCAVYVDPQGEVRAGDDAVTSARLESTLKTSEAKSQRNDVSSSICTLSGIDRLSILFASQ